ncbi:MAG: hypothetical protein QOJ06_468 [Pseudonocardiales bacterium]|jgi:hypothetical protein|nr:hypothetical protein [Pseudonocardiales bacterium]
MDDGPATAGRRNPSRQGHGHGQLTASALSPVGLNLSGWVVVSIGLTNVAWLATAVLVASMVAVLPIPDVLTFGRRVRPSPSTTR